MNKETLTKKEKIADYCELPKDVVLGAPILSLVGNRQLQIENFKNIMEYTEEHIQIQCKNYILCILGKRLLISCYTKEELSICGKIDEIKFK